MQSPKNKKPVIPSMGLQAVYRPIIKNIFLSAFNPLAEWRLTTIKVKIKSRPHASATENFSIFVRLKQRLAR